MLHRWNFTRQCVPAGLVRPVHVPDTQMPVDFLTKWVGKAKVAASLAYLTGPACRVPPKRS